MLLHGRGREVTYVQQVGGGGARQVEVLGLPGGQVGQRQGRPRVRGMLQKHARKRERGTSKYASFTLKDVDSHSKVQQQH